MPKITGLLGECVGLRAKLWQTDQRSILRDEIVLINSLRISRGICMLTFQIPMWVSVLLRLTESNAVNDGGVVEGIREDCVFWRQHRLEETRVGVEAGPVQDRVLTAVELRQTVLQFL